MTSVPGPTPPPTVDADEVRTALADPSTAPVVLDVRWHLRPPPKGRRKRLEPAGEEEYDAGHVPGAVFVDLDTELAGPPGPAGRHPLPDPDDLEVTLRRAGVRRDSTVVVYDGGDGMAAARAWWVLRWAGLPPGRVRVLDGGWPAWTTAGGEVSTASGGSRRPGDVVVSGGGMPVLTADRAAELGRDESAALIDARAPERYRGEAEPIDPVAGHVPGAVNLPSAGLIGEDGRWRAPEEVADVLRGHGGAAATVGAYCGSGVSAAMLVLALEHAGVRPPEDPAGLYVGSWSHWCGGDRPIETGTVEPGAVGTAPS